MYSHMELYIWFLLMVFDKVCDFVNQQVKGNLILAAFQHDDVSIFLFMGQGAGHENGWDKTVKSITRIFI